MYCSSGESGSTGTCLGSEIKELPLHISTALPVWDMIHVLQSRRTYPFIYASSITLSDVDIVAAGRAHTADTLLAMIITE